MAKIAFIVAILALVAPTAALRGNATVPITQSVSIDGNEVYSGTVGQGSLNKCKPFSANVVSSKSRPAIKVCGSQTKVTVYLRNRCVGYHEYTLEIGACDTKVPSDTCVEQSPATVKWMQTAQSYEISQCATA